MRILWVGTKSPWPPVDGGRLVAWLTIEALHAAGHQVRLVVPADEPANPDAAARLRGVCEAEVVAAPPLTHARALLATLGSDQPATAHRHAQPALARRVADLVAREAFDVVHAEQPHALAACAPALDRKLPVVLRAHNVESDLWAAAGREPGVRGLLARREARRVERWEGACVREASATVALTEEDAARLRALAGPEAEVHRVAAPFPAALDAGAHALAGGPAIVLAGSAGWLPNERGAAWFVGDVWPAVARAVPGARLHVFGGRPVAADGCEWHPAPQDSRDVFAPGSIHAVPLRFASGVRMRILEAWARGVPVVASPAAASGLEAADGRELLVAATPEAFARAIARAGEESASLVAAGRARLQAHHDPATIAGALVRVYRGALR